MFFRDRVYCVVVVFFIFAFQTFPFHALGAKTSSQKSHYGLSFVRLYAALDKLNSQFKAIDQKFTGLPSTQEYHYFQYMPHLQGKSFTHPLIELQTERLIYKKLLEYYIIRLDTHKNPQSSQKISSGSFNKHFTKPLHTTLQTIHPQLESIHLQFYDKVLYSLEFKLAMNTSDMNDFLESYHKRFGENSHYNKTTETYTWSIPPTQINVNISFNASDHYIQVQFLAQDILQKIQQDSDTIHQFLQTHDTKTTQ